MLPTRPTAANTPPRGPRRLLAIETSGRFGSVAAIEANEANEPVLLTSRSLGEDQRSARSLAPAIAELLVSTGWERASIGCVGVAVGPGSFTGLRVGVTTAKAMAFAWDAALVGIDTLAALAHAAHPEARGWAVLDAQRGELYAAPFDHRSAGATRRVPLAELAAALRPGDTLIGPVASMVEQQATRSDGAFLDVEPAASDVAKLAWRRWLAGEIDDPLTLVPAYHRTSAAEEKADTTAAHAAD